MPKVVRETIRIFAAYASEVAYNDPAVINIIGFSDDRFVLQSLEGILNSRYLRFITLQFTESNEGLFPKILVDNIREFSLSNPRHFWLEISRIGKIADLLKRRYLPTL